jgi:hypothetical protein
LRSSSRRVSDAAGADRSANGLEVELDLEVVAWVGGGLVLAALLGAFLFFALRASDPARAIASAETLANTPFALSFAANPGEYRVWLRFDVDHWGGEDGYGLTATLDVTGAGPPFSVEHRIGDEAPVLGGAAEVNSTLLRVSHKQDSEGCRTGASAWIATVVAPAPGGTVNVRGKVVVAPSSTARSLLVFVVPA